MSDSVNYKQGKGNNEKRDIFVEVPRGWSRGLENDSVFYMSPSSHCLRSKEDVVKYLLSDQTCKCGLECPLFLEKTFNFDAALPSRHFKVNQSDKAGHKTMCTLTMCAGRTAINKSWMQTDDQSSAVATQNHLLAEKLGQTDLFSNTECVKTQLPSFEAFTSVAEQGKMEPGKGQAKAKRPNQSKKPSCSKRKADSIPRTQTVTVANQANKVQQCITVHSTNAPILHSYVKGSVAPIQPKDASISSSMFTPRVATTTNTRPEQQHVFGLNSILPFPSSHMNASSYLASLSSSGQLRPHSNLVHSVEHQAAKSSTTMSQSFTVSSPVEIPPLGHKPNTSVFSGATSTNNIVYLPGVNMITNPSSITRTTNLSPVTLGKTQGSYSLHPSAGNVRGAPTTTSTPSHRYLPPHVITTPVSCATIDSAKAKQFMNQTDVLSPSKSSAVTMQPKHQMSNLLSSKTGEVSDPAFPNISAANNSDKHKTTKTSETNNQPGLQYCSILLQPTGSMVPQGTASTRSPNVGTLNFQNIDQTQLAGFNVLPLSNNTGNSAVLGVSPFVPYVLGIAPNVATTRSTTTAANGTKTSAPINTSATSTSSGSAAIAAAYSAFVSIAPAAGGTNSFSQQLMSLVGNYAHPYWQQLLAHNATNPLAYQLLQMNQLANLRGGPPTTKTQKHSGQQGKQSSTTTSSGCAPSNQQGTTTLGSSTQGSPRKESTSQKATSQGSTARGCTLQGSTSQALQRSTTSGSSTQRSIPEGSTSQDFTLPGSITQRSTSQGSITHESVVQGSIPQKSTPQKSSLQESSSQEPVSLEAATHESSPQRFTPQSSTQSTIQQPTPQVAIITQGSAVQDFTAVGNGDQSSLHKPTITASKPAVNIEVVPKPKVVDKNVADKTPKEQVVGSVCNVECTTTTVCTNSNDDIKLITSMTGSHEPSNIAKTRNQSDIVLKENFEEISETTLPDLIEQHQPSEYVSKQTNNTSLTSLDDEQAVKHDQKLMKHDIRLSEDDQQLLEHNDQSLEHDQQSLEHGKQSLEHGKQSLEHCEQRLEHGEQSLESDEQSLKHADQALKTAHNLSKNDGNVSGEPCQKFTSNEKPSKDSQDSASNHQQTDEIPVETSITESSKVNENLTEVNKTTEEQILPQNDGQNEKMVDETSYDNTKVTSLESHSLTNNQDIKHLNSDDMSGFVDNSNNIIQDSVSSNNEVIKTIQGNASRDSLVDSKDCESLVAETSQGQSEDVTTHSVGEAVTTKSKETVLNKRNVAKENNQDLMESNNVEENKETPKVDESLLQNGETQSTSSATKSNNERNKDDPDYYDPVNFTIGDVVWAQARGLPSWPGKIVDEKDVGGGQADNGKKWVMWFGDHTFSQVEIEKLKTLTDGLKTLDDNKGKKRKYRGKKTRLGLEQAIGEALEELEERENPRSRQGSKPKRRKLRY